MKNKFLTIHGHFYQPLRTDPWHSTIERELTALPYHNWNQKITDECYGPNALKRILIKDKDELISVYSYISFNFGPTLLSWIEDHYPDLYVAILEADRISLKIFGHGNAIAQIYNHQIMPLSSKMDKKIQVRWGKEYFKYKFKREPEGMWLSEMAVDEETLECLISEGIKFTILSPHQAKISLPEKFNILKPYKWQSKIDKNKFITLFFYDREIGGKIIPELENTDKFYLRIYSRYTTTKDKEIVTIASDGENYGHHLKMGDKYLASLINKVLKEKKISITNFAAFLENYSDYEIIDINEKTSWSCPHGIGRWEKNCGCRFDKSVLNQNWRADLRNIFNELSKRVDKLFFEEGFKYFLNPEQTLENYIYCLVGRSPEEILNFIHSKAGKHLNPSETRKALLLLEMQKHKFLMNMSCGWFFDDVTNLETIIVIKQALRVCEIAESFGLDFSNYINQIKNLKSNYKAVKFDTIIEGILKNHYTLQKAAIEQAISNMLGYIKPFECHTNYRTKVIKEERKEKEYTALISVSNLNTLEYEEFFINLKLDSENIFYKSKKSKLEDWEQDLKKLIEKKDEFSVGDISIFQDEKKNIFLSFIRNDEKSKLIRNWLISLSKINPDFESAKTIFQYLKDFQDKKIKESEIPFVYEAIKFILIESAKYDKEKNKEILEWINFISNSPFKALLWKRELFLQKDIIKI